MPTSIIDGPFHVYGPMGNIPASFSGSPVPDPNQDAGPSIFYQGIGVPDPRLVYLKDRVQGRTGVVQGFQDMTLLRSVSAVPAAANAANISSVAGVVSGAVMVGVPASSVGVSLGVPIRLYNGVLNGSAPTTMFATLDYGFAFGSITSGSATVTVADSRMFTVGMPLCIPGGLGGNTPLLTKVATIPNLTTITLNPTALPRATLPSAPIGTGEIWSQNTLPLAAQPYIAGGPALFLDPRQALTRGISITGGVGSTGGAITVSGWDIYGIHVFESITVPAGGVGYSKKTYKHINAVTPLFTDPHTYTVGTSDLFGYHFRAPFWEETVAMWNGVALATAAGFVPADHFEPATALTGDTRGTLQVSANGGGTPIVGPAVSNGAISGLVMTGRRLEMRQFINMASMLRASPTEAKFMFGVNQFGP